jgi:hypothetical protein
MYEQVHDAYNHKWHQLEHNYQASTCDLDCKWLCMQSTKWKATSSKFVTGLKDNKIHEMVNLSTSKKNKIAHTREKYITLKLINFSNLDSSQLISSNYKNHVLVCMRKKKVHSRKHQTRPSKA